MITTYQLTVDETLEAAVRIVRALLDDREE
jgi:hypothetical protein